MPLTSLTREQLLALFHDNNTGDITELDGRNFIQSSFGWVSNGNPGPQNDRVDSQGIGGFFDQGNRWLQIGARLLIWHCFDGTPNAAVWKAALPFDEPGINDLTGLLRDGTLSNTGVAPGPHGDATHYATFTVDAKGRLLVAGQLPFPSGGGTVTSVGLQMPVGWIVTGSPITTSGTIQVRSPLTTKGDLLCFSSHDDRFPVGSPGQVVVADPITSNGLVWAYIGSPGRPNGNSTGGQYMFDLRGPGGVRCWYVAGTNFFTGLLGTHNFESIDNGHVYAVPFQSPGGRIDKLGMYVVSGDMNVGNFRFRCGIYAAGNSILPYPQNLIVDLGEVIVPLTATFTLFETPGGGGLVTTPGAIYWLVMAGDIPPGDFIVLASLYGTDGGLNPIGYVGDTNDPTVVGPGVGWRFPFPYGPLPDPFPGDTIGAEVLVAVSNVTVPLPPAIYFHFQS